MVAINSILVVVDPTAQVHPAIEKAERIAAKCNARMELFACETKESRSARYAVHMAKGAGGDFILDLRALLEPLALSVRKRGIDVCIDTGYGDPLHAVLLERVKRTCADLVVKDTHHHSLAKRTFITNTDWHLIRACPVPLLLTKPKRWSDAPLLAAAVDPDHVNDKPGELDRHILNLAQMLSHRLGGSLHVLHAYLSVALVAAADGGHLPVANLVTVQMIEEQRAAEQAALESLTRPYGVDTKNLHLQWGIVSEVLPKVAQDIGADIVAMGAIARSGLQRAFIGSSAEKVLEHISCDVLVIKSPDFAADLPF